MLPAGSSTRVEDKAGLIARIGAALPPLPREPRAHGPRPEVDLHQGPPVAIVGDRDTLLHAGR